MFLKLCLILFASFVSVFSKANTNRLNYIVLHPDKPFVEQITGSYTIYEIRYDFDLRQQENVECKKKVEIGNHGKYFQSNNAIILFPGQGLWVQDGCHVVNSSLKTVLSKNGCYVASTQDTVFLVSSKAEVICYKKSGLITMPEGCVLKFEGGKLNNGLIRSVRTQIDSAPVCIFGENMSFAWYWDIQYAYPEWFGAKGDKSVDDWNPIQRCLDAFRCAYLTNHQYYCSNTIIVPSQGRLQGRGMYKTSIRFTKAVDYMCCTPKSVEANDVSIGNFNMGVEDNSISVQYGIYVPKATRSRIEDVMIYSTEVGFALDVYFGSMIKNSVANNCKVGFYLGVHGGSNTSIDYDNCYANKCTTGHLFRKSYYVTCKNTSADFCNIAYDFIESNVTLISPGAEECTYFMKITEHKTESAIGNYAHNNVHVINGLGMNLNDNPYGVIYINTKNRNYDDRNRVVIDGLNLTFANKKEKSNKVVCKIGDTVLHLNNLTSYIQPNMGMTNCYRDGVGVTETVSSLYDWTDKVIGTSIFVRSLNQNAFWNGNDWLDSKGGKIY